MICDMIARIIDTYFPDIELVGTSQNGRDVLNLSPEQQPDIAIVDIMLPGENGLDILQPLKNKYSKIKVLIYSGFLTLDTISMAVAGRADGVLDKSEGVEALKIAITVMMAEGFYYNPEIIEQLQTA